MRKNRKENITLLKKFLDDIDRNNPHNSPKRDNVRDGVGKPKPRNCKAKGANNSRRVR